PRRQSLRRQPGAHADPPHPALRRGAGTGDPVTTPARLEEYREVATRGTIELLLRLAERLRGRRFIHVNASRFGAGSPEALARLVPMMQDLGIDTSWEVMVGDGDFYSGARQLEVALGGPGVGSVDTALRSLAGAALANAA